MADVNPFRRKKTYRTPTGRLLTDADIEKLADEAEHGYDVTRLQRRADNELVVDAIAVLWQRVPEQRFGQLVMNLSREQGGFADTWEWSNETWLRRIEEATKTWAR